MRSIVNNDNLREKINFRKSYATPDDVVYDLFAGDNSIWSQLPKAEYFGFDKKFKGSGNAICDSYRVAPHIDFSKATIIDIDCYGVPWRMLELLRKNSTIRKGTRFFLTLIALRATKDSREPRIFREVRGIFHPSPVIARLATESILREWTTEYEEYELISTQLQKKYLTFVKEK